MTNKPLSPPGLDADILSALGIAGKMMPGIAGSLAETFSDLPRSPEEVHPAPPDEPLVDALRREFERVLADPSQLAGTADWPAHQAGHHESAPDFDALGALAAPYVHLRDLMLPPLSIDSCIAGFDTGDAGAAAGLLGPLVPPDVLRLFAPETPQSGHMFGRMFGLPGETRRDHHQLTTGTAMRPGRFTTPAAEAPHDPDAASA